MTVSVHPIAAARNAQNEHIASRLEAARQAVAWLGREGFTVISVQVRNRNPVIWIEGCAHCARLDGGVHTIRGSGVERETVMAAVVMDCEVHWRAS